MRRRGSRAGASRVRPEVRRQMIAEILARGVVGTQEDLRRHLSDRGIEVAQATLSRDIAALGVRRVAGAGGPRYEANVSTRPFPLDPIRPLVERVDTNGVTVVVRTQAGAASTVARAIDDARLPGALGTLAGDDTIFVAPTSPRRAGELVRAVKRLLGQG